MKIEEKHKDVQLLDLVVLESWIPLWCLIVDVKLEAFDC